MKSKESTPIRFEDFFSIFCLHSQVLSSVGLVIKLHDILEVGEGVVLPGDGAAIVPVKARLVVFKPFIGEVIVGRIVLANEGGIRVTMQFFEHIWIAANQLPPGSELYAPLVYLCVYSFSSEAEGQWKWNYDNHSLWMEVGAQIRFVLVPSHDSQSRLKVSSVLFNKPTTSKKKKITPEEQIELPTTPMAIFV